MLMDRGYLIGQEELTLGFETYVQQYFGDDTYRYASKQLLAVAHGLYGSEEKLIVNAVKRDDPTHKIIVWFPQESPLSVKAITTYARLVQWRVPF